jgi:hypothetical protein
MTCTLKSPSRCELGFVQDYPCYPMVNPFALDIGNPTVKLCYYDWCLYAVLEFDSWGCDGFGKEGWLISSYPNEGLFVGGGSPSVLFALIDFVSRQHHRTRGPRTLRFRPIAYAICHSDDGIRCALESL